MITDKIDNLGKYDICSADMQEAILSYIEEFEKTRVPDGRYDLFGSKLFVLVQRYMTKAPETTCMESHRVYADLQYIARGCEHIRWNPVSELSALEDRTPKEDMIFYQKCMGRGDVRLSQGMFAYFLPEDAHQPCLWEDCSAAEVVKLVFKLRV